MHSMLALVALARARALFRVRAALPGVFPYVFCDFIASQKTDYRTVLMEAVFASFHEGKLNIASMCIINFSYNMGASYAIKFHFVL